MESQCTSIGISEDGEVVAFGDEMGYVYLYSLEDFTMILSIKSMGSSITDIAIDASHTIIIAYEDIVSVFDKYGSSVRLFQVEKSQGKIVKLKIRDHILLACTEKCHFYLFDIHSDGIISDFVAKNGDQVSKFTYLGYDKDFMKGFAGNEDGQVVSFNVI